MTLWKRKIGKESEDLKAGIIRATSASNAEHKFIMGAALAIY
jgi:hypothetical protein